MSVPHSGPLSPHTTTDVGMPAEGGASVLPLPVPHVPDPKGEQQAGGIVVS